MTAHGFQSVDEALRSLQSKHVERAVRHVERRTAVAEMESYLGRAGINIRALKVVHVAGTKGKGSVCALTDSILRHYRLDRDGRPVSTGLFTSPHLRNVRERIRVDGAALSSEEFDGFFWSLFDRLYDTQDRCGPNPPMPAYFRFMTLLAFKVFLAKRVDVAVVEVGIGGLCDPTNCVPRPVVCGITSIGYDHCEILGNTLESIAAQKAGIIKQGVPVCTIMHEDAGVLNVIRNEAARCESRLTVVGPLPDTVLIGLEGQHQRQNASLALSLAAAALDDIEPGVDHAGCLALPSVQMALRDCRWPGRCQRIALDENLTLFVDGAHTVDSMSSCARWFASQRPASPHCPIVVFNCSTTRDPVKLLTALSDVVQDFSAFISCPFKEEQLWRKGWFPKASGVLGDAGVDDDGATWQDVLVQVWKSVARAGACSAAVLPDMVAVVGDLRRLASKSAGVHYCVLMTGSLYLAGDALDAIDYPVV
ncbi:tetrahydrofolate synthase [Plasmodiophora brassicae]